MSKTYDEAARDAAAQDPYVKVEPKTLTKGQTVRIKYNYMYQPGPSYKPRKEVDEARGVFAGFEARDGRMVALVFLGIDRGIFGRGKKPAYGDILADDIIWAKVDPTAPPAAWQ